MTRLKKIVIVLLLIGAVVALYFVRFSPGARRAAHLKRGEQYFQAKEYDKAKLEFLNVARADSKDRLAVERLGAIWVAQGAPGPAIPFLTRVLELSPDDSANQLSLGQAHLALGDFISANKHAEAVLSKKPEDDGAWVLRADSAFTKEQNERMEKGLADVKAPNAGQEYASAVAAMKKQAFVEAEQKLAKAVKDVPAFARAHIRLSDLRLRVFDVAGATKELEKAFDVAPTRSLEKIRYPEFLAQQGKTTDAKVLIEKILAEAPDYLPASLMLGSIAIREKNYPEAMKALETVLQRDPNNYRARVFQAQIQVAQNNAAGAVENLERLANTYPNAAIVHFELGRAYAVAGRISDAVASARRAATLNPAAVDAKMFLAELELRNEQPQAALEALKDLVAKVENPTPAQVQAQIVPEKLQAAALRALNRNEEAIAIYRKHTEIFPGNASFWKQLGAALREQQKYEDARTAFERALKLEPNDIATVNSLVEFDMLARNYDAALAKLAVLDEKMRGSAEAKVIEGRIYGAQKKWPEAEAALQQALQLNPNLDIAYQLLIGLYYENGRFDDAVARLEEKLAKMPDDEKSRMLLAGLYEKKKDFPKARTAYEQILARKGDSFIALNNLAYLLSEQFGDFVKAEEVAKKARAVNAENPLAIDTLGWILYRRGDYEGALNTLRENMARMAQLEARGQVPAEIYFHLGMASSAMGNFEQAKAAFAKAMASTGDFPSKAEVPERLALMKPAKEEGVPLDRLRALSKEKPGDPLVLMRLGETLEVEGKEAEAIAAYEQVLKVNPKLASIAARLARIHSATNPNKALEFAKLARAIAPSDAAVAVELGVIAAKLGDANWAYSLLQQGTVTTEASPANLLEFAKVAYRMGKVSEAKQALARAAAANPPPDAAAAVQSHLRMMELASEPTAQEAAAQEIAAVLKEDGNHLPALMADAAVLSGKKDFKGAISRYEAILQANPGSPLAQSRLAAAVLDSGGSWEKAHELAEACREVIPGEPTATLVLGETYYRRREYSRSVDLLVEAGRTKPLDAKRLFILGSGYFELRNKLRSEEVLKQAIAAGLQSPELEQAEALLKKLKG